MLSFPHLDWKSPATGDDISDKLRLWLLKPLNGWKTDPGSSNHPTKRQQILHPAAPRCVWSRVYTQMIWSPSRTPQKPLRSSFRCRHLVPKCPRSKSEQATWAFVLGWGGSPWNSVWDGFMDHFPFFCRTFCGRDDLENIWSNVCWWSCARH